MAAKKVGVLVKEARTAAGLTQEKLAKAAGENLTAADISKCERGEADLTAAQLKKIAVACNVTQTSLVNAPKNLSASAAKKAAAAKTASAKSGSTAAKTSSAKTSSAKSGSTAAKTGSAKSGSTAAKTGSAKSGSTAAKTSSAKTGSAKSGSAKSGTAAKKDTVPANANVSMKVTAAEQKLIQAYRESTSDRKKAALKLLKGEYGDAVDKLLSVTNGSSPSSSSESSNIVGDLLGNVLGGLLGGK